MIKRKGAIPSGRFLTSLASSEFVGLARLQSVTNRKPEEKLRQITFDKATSWNSVPRRKRLCLGE